MRRPVIYVAGTWAGMPEWIASPDHPFQRVARALGLYPAYDQRGQLFNWSTKLGGIWPFNHRIWRKEADELVNFALLQSEINFFGHSHGGQLMIYAAKMLADCGRRVRTMTTISTPRRRDVPALDAQANTDYWQHTFDPRRDWIGTMPYPGSPSALGQFGDGTISLDRSFRDIPGVVNIEIPAGHSDVFERPVLLVEHNIFGPIMFRP